MSSHTYRKRRGIELFLCAIAWVIGVGSYLLIHLNRDGLIPPSAWAIGAIWALLCLGVHFIVSFTLPYADPIIVPCVLLLNGVGLAMIHRLDLGNEPLTSAATNQMIWTLLGVAIFAALSIWIRDYRRLQGLSYLLFIVGMILLLLPMIPGLASPNNGANGSQIWIQIAGYSFQPAEVAKIILSLAFASYLTENRELLQLAGRRIAGVHLPRLRDLVPILIMWCAALMVLVFQNDLGTSLLFFGLFVMMLYVATNQIRWPAIALGLFILAAAMVETVAPHVKRRISSWLHPFSDYESNYQIITAHYGMAWGGLFGRGWGQGRPGLTPVASSDFISAAIVEELGTVTLIALVLIYLLIVMRGLSCALVCRDTFGKLLASGLSFVIALQVFAIIGGVTRLLPLTGLTTPFVSQGGSSLIANWIVIALLMQISHQARSPLEAEDLSIHGDLSADLTQQIDSVGVRG